jgi:DNA-binding NarL/FixJ family response regulator
MRVRIVVAEDNLIARQGILQLIALHPEFEVVAACGDLAEALEAVERDVPDVVVTDIRMPPSLSDEGIQLANRLRDTHPGVGVIVLSQYEEPGYALSLLDRGSDGRGYLLKEHVHDPAQLRNAIQAVARGGAVIDPTLVDALVKGKAAIERSPEKHINSILYKLGLAFADDVSKRVKATLLFLSESEPSSPGRAAHV